MGIKTRALVALLLLTLVVLGSLELVNLGIYGWTIFIVIPLCAGGIASWTFRPRTAAEAIETGILTGFLGSCLFLALGVDGMICVVMALIPAIALSVAGSTIVYCCFGYEDNRTAAMVLLLPMSVWFDTHAKPVVYVVRTSLIINAPPERVWKYTVAFPDITQSPDWVLRTGIAYPLGTRLEGTGLGAKRYCELSTGPVVERVVAWEPPYFLKFRVISTPPSMVETGLYGRIYPKHLTGYYTSKAGQFTLTPLPRGRTLLEGTSWYQHGLWPAEYWRWWSDAIVHRIHARVLEHIRSLSESPV
jgi:hypothetical protein